MKYCLIILSIALLVLSGCKNESKSGKIERLDLFFYDYPTMTVDDRITMVDSLRQGIDALFFIMGDTVSEVTMESYALSKVVKMFTPDVVKRLNNQDSIERVLWQINVNAGKRLPTVSVNNVYGVVSPYNQSIFVVDSILLIGLNHYLGSDYQGYSNFDSYKRLTKSVKYLPYDIVEAVVSSEYPYVSTVDATVLNRMLYEGALVYSKMQLVPNANLSDALGYTSEQMRWVQNNGKEVWNRLVARRLLYSTLLSDADRLLLPSPATILIHPDAPGRVGRYIGYMIVYAYMEHHPEIPLKKLLSPEFYNSPITLVESQYNGD